MVCVSVITADASNIDYYFYHPENRFGSDLYFNPLNVLVNGSYDILRNGGHDRNVFALPYREGWDNVFDNLLSPISRIKRYGYYNFFSEECFNITLDSNKGQFIPNVTTHLIGHGMLYVMLAEWYDHHGIRYPKTCSLITTVVYQTLNEINENDRYRGLNVDPISDMLIFNPLGLILFSTEFGKRFFSKTVSLYYWSLQPVINPISGNMYNAGQQYIMKWKPPFSEKYSAFFYWGINGLGGVSYSRDELHNYSFGVGTVANKLREKRKNGGRFLTPAMDGAMGFFYDKNNSLMCSLILTGPRMYNARLNVFPRVIKDRWYIPGFYLGFGEWDLFICGITYQYLPAGICAGSSDR